MLVNVSGLPGHAMAIDLNIEHLIGDLKVEYPIYYTCDCGANTTPES